MDYLDINLLSSLKKNGRASLSDLAIDLGVTRVTVRSRIKKLTELGEIAGFTVLTKQDVTASPVRGLMMLEIEGTGAQAAQTSLLKLPQVKVVHTTNGNWDLIVELATSSLEEFDEVLFKIRKFRSVKGSETNLLLSSKRI